MSVYTMKNKPLKKPVLDRVSTLKWTDVLGYIGLILWALICLFPVYWMLTFSLKNNAEIFGENVIGLPRYWIWSNYTQALNTGHMSRYFLNSVIVAVMTIVTLTGMFITSFLIGTISNGIKDKVTSLQRGRSSTGKYPFSASAAY